jgi:signal transduction histidine kinase
MDVTTEKLRERIAELEARNSELVRQCGIYRTRIGELESAVAGPLAAADVFFGRDAGMGGEAVWLLRDGTSGRFLFAGPEFSSVLGGSAALLYEDPRYIETFVHPDDTPLLHALFSDGHKGTGGGRTRSFRLVSHKDGRTLTAALHRHTDEHGGVLDTVVAASDCGWRLLSFRRFETFFRAFLDAVPEPLALLDAAGSIVAANRASAARHRVPFMRYLGGRLTDFLSEAAAERRLHAMNESQRTRRSVVFREVQEANRYECVIFPVLGVSSDTPLFGLLERDVTERESVRQTLVRINRDLEARVRGRTKALEVEVQERKRMEQRLLREREFIKLLVQASPNLISVFDSRGALMFANRAWREFYGLPGDVWGVADAGPRMCGYFGAVDREVLQEGRVAQLEERIVGTGGRREWFDVIRAPITMPDGETLLLFIGINVTSRVEATRAMEAVRKTLEERVKERTAALGRVNDRLEREIAERKLHEELIVQHRNHLEALMNALADSALLMDTGGRIITLNITAAQRLGLPERGSGGQVFFDLLQGTTDTLVWRDALHEVLETFLPARFEVQAFGLELDVTYYPVFGYADWVTGVAVYMMDVTEQKQISRRLRRLSAQVLSAQEEERKRIGRELHDSMAQTLSGIKFMLEGERSRLEQSGTGWPTERISKTIEYVQHAIVETRRIVMDLRPTVLDDLGLIAALRWLQQEMSQIHSLTITSHLSLPENALSDVQKSVLFRVAQEALNNVIRHSGSDSARISLEQVGEECVMTVTDNGSGFDRLDNTRNGIGLDSMRERLELICGRLDIVTEKGIGTVVRAVVPLDSPC